LPTVHGGALYRWFAAWARSADERKRQKLGSAAIAIAQKLVEATHSRERRALLKSDRQTVKMLSFSGRPE